MDTDPRFLFSDLGIFTLWLNYFLLCLDFIIIGLLIRYTLPLSKKEWGAPHVNFAIALAVWMLGIIFLRSASVIRVTNDFTCYNHACVGGGLLSVTLYNIGTFVNAAGLIFVIRSIGVSQGHYTWLKLIGGALLVATTSFVIINNLQGIFR